MPTARPRSEVESEMRDTIGLVPSFFEEIPDELVDYEWTLFKRFELDETLIPNKYKELIGVAIHSETKCDYCTLFHTEAAKLFGATDEEIQEAVHYAKTSLGWSAYLNGMRVDRDQFAEELEQIGEHLAEEAEMEPALAAESEAETLDGFREMEEAVMASEDAQNAMAGYHDLVQEGRREIYRIEP